MADINMTLAEARQIFQGIKTLQAQGIGTGGGGQPIAPRRLGEDEDPPPGYILPGTPGGTGGTGTEEPSSGGFFPPGTSLFNPTENELNEFEYRDDEGLWRDFDGTVLPQWRQKELNATRGTSGTAGDPYAANREARAAAGFASDEQQRAIRNAMEWQDLLNSQKYADRNYDLDVTQADRGELGNRANLGLDLAGFIAQQANSPSNFPAYLKLIGQTQGVPGQSLANSGSSIGLEPNVSGLIQNLLKYAAPMNTDTGAVRDVYNTQGKAAADDIFRRFQEYDDAQKQGRGLSIGGSFVAKKPMSFKDLTTGKTIHTAAETGPERITVEPMDVMLGREQGTDPLGGGAFQGTEQALGGALGAGGFSFIPRDIIARLNAGEGLRPGDFPDWMLEKLPSSLRQMAVAAVRARLGQSGLEDWNDARSQYEMPGFAGIGGILR